jgi:hypothetical protein
MDWDDRQRPTGPHQAARKHAMNRIDRSRSGPAGSTVDPEWGRHRPRGRGVVPEMALELARKAEPGL